MHQTTVIVTGQSKIVGLQHGTCCMSPVWHLGYLVTPMYLENLWTYG